MTQKAPTNPTIQIRPGNLRTSPGLEARVRRKLAGAFRRHGAHMTGVEVHFEDVNGPKQGENDFHCVMEARVNGRAPVAVRGRANDLYAAIDAAARKLNAALARAVERTDARARRRFRQEVAQGLDSQAPEASGEERSTHHPRSTDADSERSRRVVIAGYGPVGRALASELEKHGVPFTVIDTNPATARTQAELGVPIVCGDATDSAVLEAAGVASAAAFAITIPDSAEAVRACAAARGLSPDVHIAVRTTYLSQGLGALRAGANSITVEEIATAEAMAKTVSGLVAERGSVAR